MLKLGFIGYGFVGKACHFAFNYNAEAIIVDPKLTSNHRSIEELVDINPAAVFVSINAPTLDDRTVDASAIYTIFSQLEQAKYGGVVVLKSTLPPEIVDDLYVKYGCSTIMKKQGPLRYVYSPEFLREDHWEEDAINPRMIILAGDWHDCKIIQLMYERHSHIKHPKFRFVDYKEAALLKYTINAFLASKVVFMNQIYQLYSDIHGGGRIHEQSWDDFITALGDDYRLGSSHMCVPGNDGQFGYGGSCFPKDVKAMIGFDKNERLSVLRESELANTKIRLTGNKDLD